MNFMRYMLMDSKIDLRYTPSVYYYEQVKYCNGELIDYHRWALECLESAGYNPDMSYGKWFNTAPIPILPVYIVNSDSVVDIVLGIYKSLLLKHYDYKWYCRCHLLNMELPATPFLIPTLRFHKGIVGISIFVCCPYCSHK
jgi:hypothetical protein